MQFDLPARTAFQLFSATRYSQICTEADELAYPLHILVRYEIEQARE